MQIIDFFKCIWYNNGGNCKVMKLVIVEKTRGSMNYQQRMANAL